MLSQQRTQQDRLARPCNKKIDTHESPEPDRLSFVQAKQLTGIRFATFHVTTRFNVPSTWWQRYCPNRFFLLSLPSFFYLSTCVANPFVNLIASHKRLSHGILESLSSIASAGLSERNEIFVFKTIVSFDCRFVFSSTNWWVVKRIFLWSWKNAIYNFSKMSHLYRIKNSDFYFCTGEIPVDLETRKDCILAITTLNCFSIRYHVQNLETHGFYYKLSLKFETVFTSFNPFLDIIILLFPRIARSSNCYISSSFLRGKTRLIVWAHIVHPDLSHAISEFFYRRRFKLCKKYKSYTKMCKNENLFLL